VELLFPSTDDESDRIILHVPSTHEKGERRPQSRNLANSCHVLGEQSFFLICCVYLISFLICCIYYNKYELVLKCVFEDL